MNDNPFDEQHPSEMTSSPTVDTPQQVAGTKIGKVSDFEKDLIESEVIESAKYRAPVESEIEDEFEQHLSKQLGDYTAGDIVKARIRMIKKSGVLVDFSYKSDGFIPTGDLSAAIQENLEEGLEIHAMIQKLETKEGYSLLSESMARAELIWDDLFDIMNRKEVVDVRIKKVTHKGYTVTYDEVTGFLHQEDGDAFTEKDTVQAVIIQVDKRRKKVLFSTRNLHTLMVKKEEMAKFFDTVAVGDELTGTVSGIKKFGAFVNLGGAEGLVHISEISWRRISHPSDVLAVGDEVTVKILAIDKDDFRLSLGMKQLTPDPWDTIDLDFEVGKVVSGKVIRVIDFGAFVLLENSVEGLIHISEISPKRISVLSDVLKVDDIINVKIIKLTKHDQKIGLSMNNVAQDNTTVLDRIDMV
ncbi:MAG: 30S ribosomal protein S1 [Candidatus Marinamargulisbacteria bacterium]